MGGHLLRVVRGSAHLRGQSHPRQGRQRLHHGGGLRAGTWARGAHGAHRLRSDRRVPMQVVGSSMPLVGEHQAQDRQLIADMVLAELNQLAEKDANAPQKPTTVQPSQVGAGTAGTAGTEATVAPQHRSAFTVFSGSCPEGRRSHRRHQEWRGAPAPRLPAVHPGL